jgi:hypothetical protein
MVKRNLVTEGRRQAAVNLRWVTASQFQALDKLRLLQARQLLGRGFAPLSAIWNSRCFERSVDPGM